MRLKTFNSVLFCGVLACFLVGQPLRADDVEARYSISLAGFPLGVAVMQGKVDEKEYDLKIHAKLVGLADILVGGQGGATAKGAFIGSVTRPQAYAITSSNGKEERTVRMGLNVGNVASLEVNPPFEERADRLPLKPEHKRNVVDPVSALMMPMNNAKDPFEKANCDRVLPVFDGLQRFNVVFQFARLDTIKGGKEGYNGQALVCKARYVPLAGYRPDRRETVELTKNKDMETWLVPVANTGILIPYIISVKTKFGMTRLKVVDFATKSGVKVGAAQ